jgi:hypothetical protein|tara:strand:- start:592 stop:1158 length:567 start_codon:yes stop_codon:yes gene_type:complete
MTGFNTIINHKEKMMIHAAHRCGSGYVSQVPAKLDNWKNEQYYNITGLEIDFNEYSHVNIIRDPYQRWRSWFYDFHRFDEKDDIDKWNLSYTKSWLDEFRYRMHYDMHTCLQKITYEDVVCRTNAMYLHMEDLDIFLGIDHRQRIIDDRVSYENIMTPKVIGCLQKNIPLTYTVDYTWIQTLNFWQNT